MRRIDRARLTLLVALGLGLAGRLVGELAMGLHGPGFGVLIMLAMCGWFAGWALGVLALAWHLWLFMSETAIVLKRLAGSRPRPLQRRDRNAWTVSVHAGAGQARSCAASVVAGPRSSRHPSGKRG